MRFNLITVVAAVLIGLAQTAPGQFAFVHPGLLQNRDDLARLKAAVAAHEEPIYSGFQVFRADPHSQATYRLRGPLPMVGRNPTVGQGDYDSDANAAYQCAVMWCITGDRAYADKSKQIVDAWSVTLTNITGRDAVLMAGLGPFKMVNAAELLRSTDAGWSPAEIQQAENNFRTVVYPVIADFAPFANGNWDTAAIKTMMAIGVFCNDRAMFERALRYYVDGSGDGRLTHYIINAAGQCQESGRDQQHTQLGLAHLGDACEIAWHQGLDLYGYDGNLLLKGFEYTAKYNLGESVPFTETLDRTGKYHHFLISTNGRGRFRAVYEEIYNHYVNRAGLTAPYTEQVVQRIRPEGPGLPGADHVGYGTLLFALPHPVTVNRSQPAAPAGLIAKGDAHQVRIAWVASVGAQRYSIQRAGPDGHFDTIAKDISTNAYTDSSVTAGIVYRYTVSAANASGVSPDADPVAICAGMPPLWQSRDVGAVALPGRADFDGDTFAIDAAGKLIGGSADQFHFVCTNIDGDGVVIARFVPQPSSQFSQFGLMLRDSVAANAADVALLIRPESTGQIEAPHWTVSLLSRASAGAEAKSVNGEKLSAPAVTFGRMTGPCWLKLERSGNEFRGYYSDNGIDWKTAGTLTSAIGTKLFAGLAVCSGLPKTTTTIQFDHVEVRDPASADTAEAATELQSPDGKVTIHFSLLTNGVPAYSVSYDHQPVILESHLGLLPNFLDGFKVENVSRSEHTGEWSPVYGERKTIPDNYREWVVDLAQDSGQRLRITFRAYNEGAAFRYTFPGNAENEIHLAGETSEFRFPPNTFGWEEHGTEGEYHRVEVSDIQPWCERPLTLEFSDGLFAGLGEAANSDYPRMLLSPLPGTPDALVTALGGPTSNTALRHDRMPNDPSATLHVGDSTPWRYLIVGRKPGDLLERDYLSLDLNPPLALKDVSWIHPGKAMRDVTLTTTNSKAVIDFAVTAGLKYLLLDSQWYGPETAGGDATTPRAPHLDLPEVIRYARSKNVGVILYVDRRQMKAQRDVLFPLYEKWGVAGVKIGFVDVGPQADTAWIAQTIRKAAEHHLVLNIHDGYRPTGQTRTYPNLLTVEGIRGNEHFPTPEHDCTLPFTRYLAGSADFTVCYYDHRLRNTHAHQLAMAVISYSPLQSILWYDRPSRYHGEPEMEFFRRVPTVWDDTKVLNGEIGKFATVARRSGNDWFIGTVNDSEPRRLAVPLSFLAPGKKYTAHLYYDDPAAATATKVGVKTMPVDAHTVLDLSLEPAGGEAMWIESDLISR